VKILSVLAACCLLLSGFSSRSSAQSCGIDQKAKWYAQQMSWLDESDHRWTNDSLRAALIGALGSDSTQLSRVQLGAEKMMNDGFAPTDAQRALIEQLRALAKTRGSTWPTKSVVGARGARAVWFLALRDTSFQRVILHRLMEAGPDESFPPDVAVLEDRIRLRDGRKQLYGTQFAGSPPTEDPKHVDLRRDGARLPPVNVSECVAK